MLASSGSTSVSELLELLALLLQTFFFVQKQLFVLFYESRSVCKCVKNTLNMKQHRRTLINLHEVRPGRKKNPSLSSFGK